MSGLRDSTRLQISGNPTADEIAAVVLALDRALDHGDTGPARRPGWQEAARREAIGGRLVRTLVELGGPLP